MICYHTKKDSKSLSKELVGKRYSLKMQFILGCCQSTKMKILSFHGSKWPTQTGYHAKTNDSGCIELRPRGIVVHLNINDQKVYWIVPFYKLNLFRSNGIHIYADGHKISLIENSQYRNRNSVFLKMLLSKISDASNENQLIKYG